MQRSYKEQQGTQWGEKSKKNQYRKLHLTYTEKSYTKLYPNPLLHEKVTAFKGFFVLKQEKKKKENAYPEQGQQDEH